jgi:putative ABC transport system permease protein
MQKQYNQMTGLFAGINGLIWIVGIGTLLAGVIGISNIMLVIVKERTKEIGIQRALGASPFNIISQIITESVFLTTFAGYAGLVIGVVILEGVNYALVSSGAESNVFKNPNIDFNMAITALVILIISGAIAGLIPARKAVSIKPIDALRYE